MNTKKPATKKITTTTASNRVHRANSKPAKLVHIKTPSDVDKHVALMLRNKAKATRNLTAPQKSRLSNMLVYDIESAAAKAIQDLEKAKNELAKMLLATTEAIEHYAEGQRKSDPIVLAHAELTKTARIVLGKFGTKSKKAK